MNNYLQGFVPHSQCALLAKGYWFAPSFLTGVMHAQRFVFAQRPSPVLRTSSPAPASEEFRVSNEEIFGPVPTQL